MTTNGASTVFKLLYYSSSWGDHLKIYDGATNTSPVVGQYCEAKSKPQNFISSTNEILLYFKSSYNSYDKKGFQIEYKTSSEYFDSKTKKVITERNFGKSSTHVFSNLILINHW